MTAPRLEPGARLHLAGPTIGRDTLAAFAQASGDDNPIHLDSGVARSMGFDDVFAHGMLSLAYLGRLLTNHVPVEQVRSLRARFTAVTPVGARPTCEGVVRQVVHVADGDRVTLDLVVTLEDGTRTLVGEAVVTTPPAMREARHE